MLTAAPWCDAIPDLTTAGVFSGSSITPVILFIVNLVGHHLGSPVLTVDYILFIVSLVRLHFGSPVMSAHYILFIVSLIGFHFGSPVTTVSNPENRDKVFLKPCCASVLICRSLIPHGTGY